MTLNENTGFCELRLSSTSPAKVEAGKGEETARIDRRRTIVKGLAGLGVVAAGAVGLSALGGQSTAAIQDATFLVQDPSADLTAEKVVGTDLALTGWDYVVWTNGTTVYGQNGRTSKIDFSGTDWAAIVNSIIGTVGAETIFVHPDVPASTTTINVNKSGVTIYCPKENAKAETPQGPFTQKIVLGGNAQAQVRRVTLWGLQMDELEVNGAGAAGSGIDVDGWTVAQCQMNNYGTSGRMGIRFTGTGDIENGLFLKCQVRAQVPNVSLITWEAPSDANGHIAFYRCQLENVGGFSGVNTIEYSNTGPGHTGTVVSLTDCSFVHIGGTTTAIQNSSVANPTVVTCTASHRLKTGQKVTIAGHVGSTPSINGVWTVTVLNSTQFTIPVNVTVAGTGGTVGSSPMSCSILRMSGTTLNAGPRTVVISNSHFELHVSAMDLFSIANATAFVYYGVIVQNPSLTIGANNYTWIQNSNVSNLHQGSLLQIRGGHLTGTDPTSFTIGTVNASPNFKVKVSDVVRFNPQGAATIAVGASPYLYTNDDGVAETVVLDGVRGATGTLSVAKDSVTLYSIGNNEKFHLVVWLEPREAITVTYTSVSGDTLTMSKNRK